MEKTSALTALGALAQETRLDIFRLLVQAGPAGLPAGQIGERLGLPSATLAFHLKELKNAHLAHCTRAGRSLIYAANYEAMNALLLFLTENCCGGPANACTPDACLPGTCLPDACLPDTCLPDTCVPDTCLPDTCLPDTCSTDLALCQEEGCR